MFNNFGFLLMFLSLALASCSSQPASVANMPNPASVYCEQHGEKLDIRSDDVGNQSGLCIFPNGSECDES